MTITLNGTTGITTPDVTSDGLTVDSTTLVVDEVNNKVGIGTSSPSTVLEVSGSGVPAIINSSNNQYVLKMSYANNTSSAYLGTFSNALILAPSSAVEAARIDSSGNLLLACTGITGDAPNADGAFFFSSSAGNVKIRRSINGFQWIQFYGSSTASPIGWITNNNNTGTTYNTASDYRLKHDIQPMTGALEKVAALKPVTYKWNVNDSAGEGFIAHELQEICPDAVSGEKDAVDAEGNPQYQGIDTSFLVATLTAAIQEQQAIIDEQKTALEALTARVSALEATNV